MSEPCPSCGYCPTCGRRNYNDPWWYKRPVPYWTIQHDFWEQHGRLGPVTSGVNLNEQECDHK